MRFVNKKKVLNIIQEEIDIILGIRTDVKRIDVRHIEVNHSDVANENDRRIKLQILNKLQKRILEEL